MWRVFWQHNVDSLGRGWMVGGTQCFSFHCRTCPSLSLTRWYFCIPLIWSLKEFEFWGSVIWTYDTLLKTVYLGFKSHILPLSNSAFTLTLGCFLQNAKCKINHFRDSYSHYLQVKGPHVTRKRIDTGLQPPQLSFLVWDTVIANEEERRGESQLKTKY